MRCSKLWMKAGTFKKPKIYSCAHYPPTSNIQGMSSCHLESLLAFHSLTGCDSVSHLVGHSKKAAWKVFQADSQLLRNLGTGVAMADVFKSAEKFVCRLYKLPDNVDTCDTGLCHVILQRALARGSSPNFRCSELSNQTSTLSGDGMEASQCTSSSPPRSE